MLRPIDTQTIYQQSHEVSNRQQAHNQGQEMQQNQFEQILHKETHEKQETVNEVREDQKMDNDLKKNQKRRTLDSKKKYKKKKSDTRSKKSETSDVTHIDIRI